MVKISKNKKGNKRMFSQKLSPTKERIYHAAISLFAEHGYDNVSARDLAKAVGITHSALYNHIGSKKDILLDLFQTYTEQRKKIIPNLNHLLKLAETAPPKDLLLMMSYHFPSCLCQAKNGPVIIVEKWSTMLIAQGKNVLY